jgi:hypothetical protein
MDLGRDCPLWRSRDARSSQGSKIRVSGEGVPTIVLDGEHDVLGLIGQSCPAFSLVLVHL